jgi:hypothetical protein
LPILSVTLVDTFFSYLTGHTQRATSAITQRYLSNEHFRRGKRLQLDLRVSAIADRVVGLIRIAAKRATASVKADYKRRGVHIVYQQTLR